MSTRNPELSTITPLQPQVEIVLGGLSVAAEVATPLQEHAKPCPELPIIPHNFEPLSEDAEAELLHILHRNRNFSYALEHTSLTPLQLCEFLCERGRSGLVAEHWMTVLDEHLSRYSSEPGIPLSQLASHGAGIARVYDYYPKEIIPTAEDLLRIGAGGAVLLARQMFADADLASAWQQVINAGDVATAVKALWYESGEQVTVPDAAAGMIARARYDKDNHRMLMRHLAKFSADAFTASDLEAYLDNYPSGFMAIYSYSSATIPWVERCIARLGHDLTHTCLQTARDILHGDPSAPIPDEWRELGITQRGDRGFMQLQEAQRSIRSTLLDGTLTGDELKSFVQLVTTNQVAESLAQQIVRFSDSVWGGTSHADWERILHNYLEAAPHIPGLSSNLRPSDVYTVRKLDERVFDPSNIDDGAKKRYSQLVNALGLAIDIVDGGRFYDRAWLDSSLYGRVEYLIHQLEQARSKPDITESEGKGHEKHDPEIAQSAIAELIQTATSLLGADLINDLPQHVEAIRALNDNRLNELCRIAKFVQAIEASATIREAAELLRHAELTPEALIKMREFVTHLVDQEYYGPLLKDAGGKVNRNQWRALQGLTLTSAFNDHITRMQRGARNGATNLQILPSRGIGLELSGHAGDSCWADETRNGSFAERYPNVTALMFVRNPGDASERLVGTALLVNTTDLDTNEDVVVIRGVNPIETYINATDVDDFLSSLFDYVRSVSGDRKIAVVIDSQGSGGAATNRPVVYSALSLKIRGNQTSNRPMRPAANSTVNHYDLSPGQHDTFYLNPAS